MRPHQKGFEEFINNNPKLGKAFSVLLWLAIIAGVVKAFFMD
jgi:hypothetical protein